MGFVIEKVDFNSAELCWDECGVEMWFVVKVSTELADLLEDLQTTKRKRGRSWTEAEY
jgi:hypothetical protein